MTMKILAATMLSLAQAMLVIQGPDRLVSQFPPLDINGKPGVIKASYANFGLIPYGHNMVSHLTQELTRF